MISYRVDARDLGSATFGLSELSEATLSLRAVNRPEVYPLLAGWLAAVRPRLQGLDTELLAALVAPDFSTPDFLNPRPDPDAPSFAEELRAVSRLPGRIVDRDIEDIHPDGRPEALVGPPEQVRDRIVATMADYWTHCLRLWWPQVAAVLRADITHRAQLITRHGLRSTLEQLHHGLDVTDTELRAWNPHGPHFDADARRRGLVFVPSLFTPHVSYPFSPREPPYLLYPSRGYLAASGPNPPDSLTVLLGRSRASLLLALTEPASSTDVAARRGTSVSAANQQLRWLRDAGMLTTVRHGRAVLYARSQAGEALVAASERARA